MRETPPENALWLWHAGPADAPDGVLVGWQDLPLARPDEVKARARDLATIIGTAQRVFTSDRRRDRAAARPLARALGCRLEATAALREIDYGRWAGLSWGQVRQRWPDEHAAYMADWAAVSMPDGESYTDLRTRIDTWWARVRKAGPVVVVAGPSALRALAAGVIGWSPADAMGVSLVRGHYAVLDPDGARPPRWNLPPPVVRGSSS